jgi:hypothetical protein
VVVVVHVRPAEGQVDLVVLVDQMVTVLGLQATFRTQQLEGLEAQTREAVVVAVRNQMRELGPVVPEDQA